MKKSRGHPFIGAIAGFFLVLGLDMILLTTGTLNIGDKITALIPLIGIPIGFAWGWFGPLGRSKASY